MCSSCYDGHDENHVYSKTKHTMITAIKNKSEMLTELQEDENEEGIVFVNDVIFFNEVIKKNLNSN